MIFTCPHCQKPHRLPEGVTPPPNAATQCKKCGQRFLLFGTDDNQPAQAQSASEPTGENPEQPPSDTRTTAIQEVFPELNGLPTGKFRLAEIFVLDSANRQQAKRNRLLSKLLVATAPLLSEHILNRGEQVHRIASGIAYFPFEIPYANGLLTWPQNHYALVATDQRLIFINLDRTLSHPTRYVFQIPYNNIRTVSKGFYGSSLIVNTVAGRKWDFTTVNRGLANNLVQFIKEQLAAIDHTFTETIAPAQLCPACHQAVMENAVSCPYCRHAYKSDRIAIKKSLLLPGTGNLYLSYRILGTLEIAGYLFTWMLAIILTIIGIPGGILGGGLLILAYHFWASFMAGRMARKGHLPTSANSPLHGR